MMKRTFTIIAIALLIFNCKEAKEKNSKILTDTKIVEIQNIDEDSIKTSITPPENGYDFLNYLDQDMLFQEEEELILYGWSCNITQDSIIFSGKVYLSPKKEDVIKWKDVKSKQKIINIINNNPKKEILKEKYNLWAQITHKQYFMPREEWVDNPCEFYKENKVDAIYYFKEGWEFIEYTKDDKKIYNLINETLK